MSGDPSYYFICNPASNTGRLKKNWPAALEMIRKRVPEDQFEWIFTDHRLHAIDLTNKAVEMGFKNIIAVGGDGVANECLNAIVLNNHNVNYGLLPMGTSNDFHLNVGHPEEISGSLDIVLNGYTEKLSIGEVNGDFSENPFFYLDHVDAGLGSLAARGARDGSKLIKGEFKYTWHALKQVTVFKRNPATVSIDGEEQSGEFTLISAAIGDKMGGYYVWPGNHHGLTDFAFCIAKGQNRLQLLKMMLAAEKGEHINFDGVELIRGKELEIHLERPWPFQAEGEIFTDGSKDITITYRKEAVDLLTNPNLDRSKHPLRPN